VKKFSGWLVQHIYLEAISHCLSEPDVLLLLDVLACVPVLVGDLGLSCCYAGLSGLHVAVDLDGVMSAALVWVDPVLAWRTRSQERKRSERSSILVEILQSSSTLGLIRHCWGENSPLFHSGWHILRSRQVLAGFLRVPSGLRICSICWLRLFRVPSTSRSRSRRTLASSARNIRKGSGAFSRGWEMKPRSKPPPGAPGAPAGPVRPGGP